MFFGIFFIFSKLATIRVPVFTGLRVLAVAIAFLPIRAMEGEELCYFFKYFHNKGGKGGKSLIY